MSVKKIEVNSNGDYKIKFDNRWVGYKGRPEIFNKDQNLNGIVNPTIINELDNAEIIKWKEPEPPSLENLKQEKINRIRKEAEKDIEFNSVIISFCDLKRLAPALTGSDEEILNKLPIKTTVENFYIDTIEKVKLIKDLYSNQVLTSQNRIVDCRKAETKEELDSI